MHVYGKVAIGQLGQIGIDYRGVRPIHYITQQMDDGSHVWAPTDMEKDPGAHKDP